MRRLSVFIGLVGYAGVLVLLRPHSAQWPSQGLWTYLQNNPERALTDAAALVGWLLAAWLFIASALIVAAKTSGASSAIARIAARGARIVTPGATRRLLEAALGVALAIGPAGAALAGPEAAPAPASVQLAFAAVPAPIVAGPEPVFPDLDRPSAASRKAVAGPSASASALPNPVPAPPLIAPVSPAVHSVVPGDTLWDLAAKASPAGASPGEITRLWQRWYAANRATVGADPNLLLPGELLTMPGATS